MFLRLALAGFFSFFAHAAVGAEGALTLSLDEAIARAQQLAPRVLREQRQTEIVRAERERAAVLFPSNPIVQGVAGHRREATPGSPLQQGTHLALHAEQTIEIAGQRGTRRAEVERALEAQNELVTVALAEVRAGVRVAYIETLVANAQLDAARESEILGERLVSSVAARVNAGAASAVEAELAALERGRLKSERVEAQIEAAARALALKRLTGVDAAAPLTLTTTLGTPSLAHEPLTTLIAQALTQRRDVVAVRKMLVANAATRTRLGREIVPNPTLVFDLEREMPGKLFVGGGIAIPIPLWRRNQGELAVNDAARARLEEELRLVTREVELEVTRAFERARLREQEALYWSREVLPAAERGAALVNQGWQAGKFDFFRVIQVMREAKDARRRGLDALSALWQAAIELELARGAA